MKKLVGPFTQILTLRELADRGPLQVSDLDIIHSGGVVIEEGVITTVDNFEKLRSPGIQVEEIQGSKILLPGFVDCHTHMCWAGSRARDYERRISGKTYQEILNEGGGIFDTVQKTRDATKEELIISLKKRVLKHISEGVTTMEVKSGYGLNKLDEIKMLKVIQQVSAEFNITIIPTFLGAHLCPPEYASKIEYLEHLVTEVAPAIIKEDLSHRADIFIEEEAFPADISINYLKGLKQLGYDITIHAGQFNPSGCQVAIDLEAISADHLESISQAQVHALSKSNVIPVALPGASIGLGMQFTPARKLLDAGCSLAIATDWNPGSAPMGDLLMQASVLGAYEKLNTAELFAGITFRAASALNMIDHGRIDHGHQANMCSFETDDYREILYHQGKMKPDTVWVKGEIFNP